MWEDVPSSAAALGAITVAYILFEWSGRTALNIMCNVALAAVLVCSAWANLGPLVGKEGPNLPEPKPDEIEKKLTEMTNTAKDFVVEAAGVGFKLLRGADPVLTGKYAVLLFLGAKLGNLFSFLTLAFIVSVGAFALPKAYELNKDKIDAHLKAAKAKGEEYIALGKKLYKEKVLEKLKAPAAMAKKTE